jgi:hypothetical protein
LKFIFIKVEKTGMKDQVLLERRSKVSLKDTGMVDLSLTG